jgi:excisionase family DNA binding protein
MKADANIAADRLPGTQTPASTNSSLEKPQLEAVRGANDVQALMLSVEQVCTLLGIGRTTLWAMVRDGELGSIKCGARVLFPRPVVEEYVQAQAAKAREQAAHRQRRRSRRTTVTNPPGSRPAPGEVNP